MKKLILLGLGLFFFAVSSRAQSADASIGYSYFRVGGSGGANLNGLSGSVAYKPNKWLGLVGDFGGYHGSPSGVSLTTYTYMFGPRIYLNNPTSITPFVQGLVGGSHVTASALGVSGSTNPFAFSFGGGVDLGFAPHLAIRPQVDYVGLRESGNTTNCTRVSIGIVARF